MKEILSILNAYDLSVKMGQKTALAVVVRVEGSSYRRMGARLLFSDNGTWVGGISGGCLEGDALKRANKAILQNKPSTITYDTTQDDAHQIGVGLGCNGIIDVLFLPVNPEKPNNPISLLRRCAAERKPHLLVTITSCEGPVPGIALGDTFYYQPGTGTLAGLTDSAVSNLLQPEITQVWQQQRSRHLDFETETGSFSAFIEFLPPPIHLALFGGNYDIYPLISLAKELGWTISLVANLQKINALATRHVDALIHNKSDEQPDIDEYSAIVLMAHDYKTDLNNLKYAIQTPAPYIGLLGPRKRADKTIAELESEGISFNEDLLERIYAPAGLDIGANAPEEIALSIVAEIRSAFSGKTGGYLKHKEGPIHERE